MNRRLLTSAVRKAVHVALVAFLALPLLRPDLLAPFSLDPLKFYAIVLIGAAALNSVQVKKELRGKEALMRISEMRSKLVEELVRSPPLSRSSIKEVISLIERSVSRFDEFLIRQLELIERDYERRGGYLGLTLGAVGVAASYMLFGAHSIYGMIALALVDPVANLVGEAIGKIKLPYTNATLEGSLAGFASLLLLMVVLNVDYFKALLIALLSCLAEAYGVEDNLAIPIASSTASWLIGARPLI